MTENKLSNKYCPVCKNYNVRGITVDALIVWDNKILLIKRKNEPYQNLWALPGGHLDWEETIVDCLVREVREETNLSVLSQRLLGVYSELGRHPRQAVAVAYIAKTKGSPKAGDDAGECRWFPLGKLPVRLAFDHEKMIKDYMGAAERSCSTDSF